MNTASLELSKELYKISDWFDTPYKHYEINGKYELRPSVKISDDWGGEGRNVLAMLAPAYDLEFLLRKLPTYEVVNNGLMVTVSYYSSENGIDYFAEADTPEDAACKLAIELFKAGVLK